MQSNALFIARNTIDIVEILFPLELVERWIRRPSFTFYDSSSTKCEKIELSSNVELNSWNICFETNGRFGFFNSISFN